ncbi:MAG: Fpg/Nei family DNA glycosylase [Phycisphaerae bacterium]|nr:Fpg/Nei family DNA glycosylase [Phycisphaerae bacterium]
MPEGHTIHLFARAHDRAFSGQKLSVSSPQRRFAAGAKKLNHRRLKKVWARGKHLFYEFDRKRIIHVHLGLHGKFRFVALKRGQSPEPPRGAVRMRIRTSDAVLDLNGPIVCEVIDHADVQKILDRLGPDVLDSNADANAVWLAIENRAKPIGELLMDQSIVCGIGNAYRCELLYRQRLHPLTPGKSLTRKQFDSLWKDAVHLLKMGVRRGQAWAVDETDVKNPPMLSDGTPDRYNVYRRTNCRGCGAKIQVLRLGGRRCHLCPKEQKLPNRI